VGQIEYAGEKITCLPCLNTRVLLLRTLALDPIQLAAHLKLARYLRAHKNTFNKQNNTPSIKSLKRGQSLALGTRTQKHQELSGALDDHKQELAMCLVYFNLTKMCIGYFKEIPYL
jgi:hypothetical protein